MGLFGALGKLVVSPITIVADVVTLGGSLTDRDKPYTVELAEDIMDEVLD